MDKKSVVCGSAILGKDMHVNVYGKKGLPVVMFPTLAASPESLEDAGVVDELAEYLDSGIIQLFCTETVDQESWAADGDPKERAQRQETYYHYVVDELVPLVHKVSKSTARPLAMGCDMGATHAAIALLRRPDLFQGCVCLSGSYDARRYFGDWMDATLYENTPCAFLPQMPLDHPTWRSTTSASCCSAPVRRPPRPTLCAARARWTPTSPVWASRLGATTGAVT